MRRWNLIAFVGMLAPPSIVLALYAYIGSFDRMLGDDYCTTYMAERLGLLRSIWYWYKSWHGRFSANIADWLLSLFGSGGYPFYTFIFVSTWVVFVIILAKKILKFRGYSALSVFPALLLAVFLVFTTLSLTPDIIGSVFWWGGTRSYLAPIILIVLYFAFYYHFITLSWNRTQMAFWLILSFGFTFFMGGFSETFTPVLVLLLAMIIVSKWLLSRFGIESRSTIFLSVGFIGALISLLVMILAPGNSIRRSYFPAPPDIFTILSIAFTSYLGFLYNVFTSPYSLTALLGSTLGSVWLGVAVNRKSGVVPLHRWLILPVILASFTLAFACFPTAVYATSEPPPARTLIIPAFILVVGFLISGFVFGEWLVSYSKDLLGWSTALLIISCGLTIFSSYGSFQSLYAMREAHRSFAQRWDQIDSMIRDAKSSGLAKVDIPALKNWADAPYPTDNPKYWPNICVSKYYDISVFGPPLEQ